MAGPLDGRLTARGGRLTVPPLFAVRTSQIGVNYKTALRMLRKIREDLMEQDYTGPLSGEVEADSAYIGGQLHEGERSRLRAEGRSNQGPATKRRDVIFAAVERDGKLRASLVGDSRTQEQTTHAIRSTLHQFVLPGSLVFTDDWGGYNVLDRAGIHKFRRIRHSQAHLRRGRRTHEHGRGLLRPLQDRRSRHPPLDLDALASRLPERMGLEVEPPRRRPRDVPQPARQRGCSGLVRLLHDLL